MITVMDFLVSVGGTVNGPEAQGYAFHNRVFVNDIVVTSPWFQVKEGDIVRLERHDARGTLEYTVPEV